MPAPPTEVTDRHDLDIVELSYPDETTEWLLVPRDATDEELKTAWIRAERDEYTSLEDAR
jgi:hypothetical protein